MSVSGCLCGASKIIVCPFCVVQEAVDVTSDGARNLRRFATSQGDFREEERLLWLPSFRPYPVKVHKCLHLLFPHVFLTDTNYGDPTCYVALA